MKMAKLISKFFWLLVFAFNIVSVGWWCWNFYSFVRYPNLTIIMTEPNVTIATVEMVVALIVLFADVILLMERFLRVGK